MKRQQGNFCRTFIAELLSAILLVFFTLLSLPAAAADAVPHSSLATIKKGLTYPIDVAVSDSGRIYVVDGLSKKILIYNNDYILSGGISTVENPTAVAVSGNTVYIADGKTRSVKLFTDTGSSAGELKKDGTAATFKLPRNITVDSNGNIYVVDQFADTIEVFDPSGNYFDTIADLSMPLDAVAVNGMLYIIDQPLQNGGSNGDMRVSRIRIFNPETGFTDGVFPPYGIDTNTGQYISLKGIAADPHNNLYLDDSYLNVIYKFDPNGTFLGIIDEQVTTPLGVTVSGDGRLLLTSSFDGTLRVLGVDYEAGINTWDNDTPVADAGVDQAVEEGAEFILDGSASTDDDGIQSYQWKQVSGINILPSNPFSTAQSQLPLTAPDVGPTGSQLVFELMVTDSKGKTSPPATTTVSVNNVISGSVAINDGDLYTSSMNVILSLDSAEAVEMRIANDTESFAGEFTAYNSTCEWTLSSYDPADAVNSKSVRVEFRDAGGNSVIATNSILLDMQPPAAPNIIDAGGAPGEFSWETVGDAVLYTLQYASNREFINAVTLTGPYPNGLTIALDDLDYGTWYWRVQAIDAAGNISAWSSVYSFEVGPDCTESPASPLLAQPPNGEFNVSRTLILKTNPMNYHPDCGTHLRTKWQISPVEDFSTLTMDVGTTLDNLTEYQVPQLVLEPATTYFWRVMQTADNNTQSGWSEVWQFTTVNLPDVQGEDGIIYNQPGDTSEDNSEEITFKEPIGDANVRIKAIRVSAGVIARTIKELDPDSIADFDNRPAGFPLGLLSFRLQVEPGAQAEVEISFTGQVPDDAEWYIYNAEDGWHVYPDAVFSRNRRTVTLGFQDGGIGDADGVANGIIVNP